MTRHSSSNGKGKSAPPVSPSQPMEIPIVKTITQASKGTTAELVTEEDGEGNKVKKLHVTIITLEATGAVANVYEIEEGGQKAILDAMTGGIELAGTADIAALAKETKS